MLRRVLCSFCPVFGGGATIMFRRYLLGGVANFDISKYKDVRDGHSWGHDDGALRLWPANGAYELPIDDFSAVAAATAVPTPRLSEVELFAAAIADGGIATALLARKLLLLSSSPPAPVPLASLLLLIVPTYKSNWRLVGCTCRRTFQS